MTLQDRQQIAAGLSKGLNYTEIAGQLARPVSTISREVARNGGRDAYQADQAHQEAQGRARRRKRAAQVPPQAPTPPADTVAHGRDPRAVQAFEERFAALMARTGLPRMTARILACLYTSDTGSLTAADLVQRLQVSPASVSNAVGDLEEQGLIRRERDPRRRREHYVIDGDVWYRAWLTSARANAALADTVRQGAATLGAATPAGARLQHMGQFLEHVSRALVQAAEEWRQTSLTTPCTPLDG
ncbi:MarR family transcriptional regulator [Streptomyces sp. NPDC001339]|uniref:GbsR/MarR family transcriptional regulator n=1 Tax=Streptomyces sp. NPDC001339 TaxID=3364563 RepID=UPI0036C61C06